ncbi:MAG: twin-arginine translocase subunit TatC [Actinomycetota bacterium]|nr:twin-arginine translocase subunit TatC [Actinomycetota bacterium]
MAEAETLKRKNRKNPFARRREKRRQKTTMTMVGHLTELRTRLIWSALAFVLISIAVFILYEPISDFLREPLCQNKELLRERNCNLTTLRITGGFNFRLKLTALVGMGLSSPVWLYQIYAFVVPALTQKEKRYALPFLLSAIMLFLLGAALAYVTLPTGLRVLFELGGEAINAIPGAEEYLDFVGFLLLGFGLMFEMPLILVFLGLAGVITTKQLRKQRRLAIVVIFILAAVVTPSQDPYTMSALAVPLYGLYELTILVVALLTRKKKASAEAS